MRKIICVIIFSIFMFDVANSQNKELTDITSQHIMSLINVSDPNPSHAQSMNEIEKIFRCAMRLYMGDMENYEEKIRENIFRVFCENTQTSYEDSLDERRVRLTRALCLASLSLISDVDEKGLYLEYALFSLTGFRDLNNSDFDLLAEPILGILFINLLYNDNNPGKKNICEEIRTFIMINQKNFTPSIVTRSLEILESFSIL